MFAARWRNRFALVASITFVALIVLLSSQHRIRLIVGSYKVVDSAAILNANDRMILMADPTVSKSPVFSKAVSSLASFDNAHPLKPGDALATLDDPDTCELALDQGRRLHCYNADIGVCSILSKQNIPARLWDMSGPSQLGGYGHNMLEVLDGGTNSWKAIDPYYHCYFTKADDSMPIDFPALRIALLTSPSSIRMVRYSDTTGTRPDRDIISELRFLAPVAMLHSNNDFRERYRNRYGWVTPITSSFFDALPLRVSRGVRMFMLGSDDRRYIIEDRFSPRYPFIGLKWLFWILVSVFCISLIGLLIMRILVNRNEEAQVQNTPIMDAVLNSIPLK